MKVFLKLWHAWLRSWYEGRLEEIKASRIAVIDQANRAQYHLDTKEGELRSKLRGLA